MAKGEYDFWILVTCLLILALQIHNPFQPGRQGACQCNGEQVAAASQQHATPLAGRAAAAAQQQAQREAEPLPVYRRPQAIPSSPSGGGLSTEDLLRELDSIQVKAKEQQDTLTAAGRMPPASPVLQQIKEMEADLPPAPKRPVAPPAVAKTPTRSQPAPLLPTATAASGVPPAVPSGGAGAGASQMPLMLQRRDDFGRFLNMRQPQGLGVILGVGRGDFAVRLLGDWTVSQGVYLVDPYIHIWRGYDDPGNLQDREHQLMYEDLRNRLVQYEGRYVLVRDFSHSFAETYQSQSPGSPTFVYVDANPAEEAVSRDLELWWQLLSPGGILAGGSYTDSDDQRVRVRTVVDRFASKLGLQVFLTHDDMPPSWFLLKP